MILYFPVRSEVIAMLAPNMLSVQIITGAESGLIVNPGIE
jgi:hypothetical protein